MADSRFDGDGTGYVITRKAPAEPTHEKPDTQGTITEHSEEN